MATIFAASNARIATGFARLFAPPVLPDTEHRAPLERPLVVLSIFFLLSLLLMWGSDYPLGLWMKEFPEELRPVARWVTDLGEGVEILVATGVLLILSLFIPSTRLRKRVVMGANAITAGATNHALCTIPAPSRTYTRRPPAPDPSSSTRPDGQRTRSASYRRALPRPTCTNGVDDVW